MSENTYAMMPYEDYVATCDAIREIKGTSAKIKSNEMAGLVSGNGDKIVALNTTTNQEYRNVQTALNRTNEGETIGVQEDITVDTIVVPKNVTLDLNGHVVTAENVHCMGYIVDTSEGNVGVLNVAEENFLIQKNNAELPIPDVNGYRFFEIIKFNELVQIENRRYAFQPCVEFSAHELLKLGSEISGAKIATLVARLGNSGKYIEEYLYYPDNSINNLLNSYNEETGKYSQMLITVFTNMPAGHYHTLIRSSCGVEFLSKGINVFGISNNLSGFANDNTTDLILENGSYSATLTVDLDVTDYTTNVVITMGGVDITSEVYDSSTGAISIPNVTGDIVITATAAEIIPETATNFCVVNGDGWISGGRCSTSGAADRFDNENYAVTNYFAVTNGDTVYVSGLNIDNTYYSGMYKADKTAIASFKFDETYGAGYVKDIDLSGEWKKFTIDNAEAGLVRICGKPMAVIDSSASTFEEKYDMDNLNVFIHIKRNGEWL